MCLLVCKIRSCKNSLGRYEFLVEINCLVCVDMDNLNWELVVCKHYRIESEIVTVVEMYFVILSSSLVCTLFYIEFSFYLQYEKRR